MFIALLPLTCATAVAGYLWLPFAPRIMSAAGPPEEGTLLGETSHTTHRGEYEWHWMADPTRVTTNPRGTTGWGKLVRSTNVSYPAGKAIKIHLCAHNPCQAIWADSKYGLTGPPVHMQRITRFDSDAAVAEEVPPPPVGLPRPPEDRSPAPPPVELPHTPVFVHTAPVEHPPAPVELPPDPVEPPPVPPPPSPPAAPLHTLQAAAPASPIDVEEDTAVAVLAALAKDTAVAAAALAEDKQLAAQHKVDAALLALARDIRRPRAYLGYCAFVLFGLCKKCQPCAWEGGCFINLLDLYAPWALEMCPQPCVVTAIPCALLGKPGGAIECVPISEETPLDRMSHYVAGVPIPPEPNSTTSALTFEVYYARLGVATLPTVCDGDCGVDVMNMMLGLPQSFETRTQLRIDVSDYLFERMREPWMMELMAACQELRSSDVALYSFHTSPAGHAPTAPAPAVAAPLHAPEEQGDHVQADEETLKAMRWASKLGGDANVLALIRSLPTQIVKEQVALYRKQDETAVAEPQPPDAKILLNKTLNYHVRMSVAQRFHSYCKMRGITPDAKMPYGSMKTFIQDNLAWTSKGCAAVAEEPCATVSVKSLLRSRAPKSTCFRKRAPGGGAKFKAPLIRQELYEWWSSIRYAIDWKQLVADNRSGGLKKNLARFPRSILVYKVNQLLQEHAHACLLNGQPVQSFRPSSWWFRRWEEDYGLSMRAANRKYQVPRHVLKQRLEIFWVNLFRLRLFVFIAFGYDPVIYNFDQSPFHHNETGSQNKATLGVRGSIVPVVEGNSDVRSRWTANLTTCSQWTAVAGGAMPYSECMFKGTKGGPVDERLQAFLRSRGFPSWFTVTMGPKGSYREYDIIAFLDKHLEPWKEGRDWRILLADDYSAHKTNNVFEFAWSRGYILLTHGGGATPVSQTPDTDLNEHVRRFYGNKECALMMEKMRHGMVVPKLTHEECMELMWEVLADPALHQRASEGFKKVGQSIDLRGAEDALVCREAGAYWNEETSDHYASMRHKIDVELAAVAEEFSSGGIVWCKRDVQRLVSPYPAHRRADNILQNLGEDFFHDDLEHLSDAEEDDADAEEDAEESAPSSDENAASENESAIAADDGDDVVQVASDLKSEGSSTGQEIVPLSASQADKLHQVRITIAALESTMEGLTATGVVRGVQCIEAEIRKQRRRERDLVRESPAVAEAFMRLRRAEEEEFLNQKRLAAQLKQRKRDATEAIAARNAAVADLKRARQSIQDMESTRACKQAINTFTLQALGAESANAGGKKAQKNRFEVLDRLSRHKVGLSPAQKNDFAWWKEAWDEAMVTEHRGNWAKIFAGWVQNVMDSKATNAFSKFMYDETCRVFHDSAALAVPGG